MAGNELYLVAALAIVGGFLLLRYRLAASKREQLAEQRGLRYAERGLGHLPDEFLRTVLFKLADGGQESHVAVGDIELDDVSVGHSVFELRAQRDVRGEWAYLTTSPAFRIHSPLTVLSYTFDRDLPHTLIKRRGPSMIVAEREVEAFTSLAGLARDVSGIERAMAVAPPNDMVAKAISLPDLGEEYFVWSADETVARTVLSPDVQELLMSSAAGAKDLAIELYGPLLILYCTSDGRLARGDVLAASGFADELCRRILASAPTTTSHE